MDLEKLRKNIEFIDRKIVELFEARMNVVHQISKYKKKNNLPVLDSSRELEVIKRNKKYLKDKALENYLEDFYRDFMDISKDYQKDLIGESESNTKNKLEISGSTSLLCILGDPVEHSMSPYMHNLSLKSLGLDYSYMAFNIPKESLGEAVEALKLLNVRGFNLTMPHKEEVIKYLDEVNESAKLIGAVNTVVNNKGKLTGYNTDGEGFVKSLEKRVVKYEGEKVVILGAGGAAKSIAIELALRGVGEVVIMNRTLEKAKKLEMIINENIKEGVVKSYKMDKEILKKEVKDSSILINTSAVGMGELESESLVEDIDVFHRDLFVADIIYEPAKTKFLSLAEKAGCRIMNGLDMLIYQGDIGFKIWTGFNMPKDTIEVLEDEFLK